MTTKRKRIGAADRRKQILEVARPLFARRGFRGTTTRQIADQANVNEAIIFRHFPKKDDLYWAVLDELTHKRNSREELKASMAAREKIGSSRPNRDEDFFSDVAEGILRRNRKDPTLVRLLLFSALERHSLSRRFFRTYTTVYWDILANYIRRRIRSGDFRHLNPLLAARGFTGMVAHYSWMQSLFAPGDYPQFDDRLVSRTLARIWLGGMQVTATARGKKK
jgi:AcrR family transcriptional regulator